MQGIARARPRILIVDDEPTLLRAMKRSLERDYDVSCAGGGLLALDMVKSAVERFDAIVCDLRMHDMSGQELYAEIMKAAPAAAERMIFLSGEMYSPSARSFLDAVPNARFEKPVDLGELRASIQERMPST